MQDLTLIYDELQRRQSRLNRYYHILNSDEPKEAKELVEEFLKLLDLPYTQESVVASLNRIINLREDSLEQILKREGLSSDEIIQKKEMAYSFVSQFHLEKFEEIIAWIEERGLLTPFYITLLQGAHSVGIAMSMWQTGWTSHIINGINRELFELFGGDEEKIIEMLSEKDLFDKHKGSLSDRSYSVLVLDGDEYKRVSYAKAFKDEIAKVEKALSYLIIELMKYEDDVFNQKDEWIEYFEQLKRAFLHTEPDELVEYWSDVDRAWMKIKTPIQIGHPLEYYEDHYRRAVALEWDVRVINTELQNSSKAKSHIKSFAAKLSIDLGLTAQKLYVKNLEQIDRTQLYIGRPIFYYGAEFNGLFSAQVVPNDESVSTEYGKKIFAYADYVRESKMSRPIMKIELESMGREFVLKRKKLVIKEPQKWYRLYDIGTIGHEFGHILWIDSNTEILMNKSGQFKNIEEFKATAGGIMAFFDSNESELRDDFIDDLVSRAVSLIAWREVGEVLPYYCEGLIHLELLYNSGVVSFDKISVKIDKSRYEDMKSIYIEAYKELVKHYIFMQDAGDYLYRYVTKDGSDYLPKNKTVREFVISYYNRYKEIGQQVAEL